MSSKPNILFILVDELRFPSVFPKGIKDANAFIKKFMPNLYTLWEKGVKFSNYHTAASACTPARGTLITGLYSQQTWLNCTLTSEPYTLPAAPGSGYDPTGAPTLNPAFPTYGRLLRETANYRTPYIGKWHVSTLDPSKKGLGLEPYGFEGYVYPDPIAYNLQGTVGYQPEYPSDLDTANAVVNWFNIENERYETYDDYEPEPWCLTVGFVNPHDREFFWAGTEIEKYNGLFEEKGGSAFVNYGADDGGGAPPIQPKDNPLKTPPKLDYDTTPPNWESAEQLEANKPPTQYVMRNFQALTWGGATDDETETEFSLGDYPGKPLPFQMGNAPFNYWERGMDSYTQVMQEVDKRIGDVLAGLATLPEDVQNNTVITFASDHGEFSGAHGFLSGKMGTVYKEAYNIPLIVVDPSNRFVAETDIMRDQFVSSVDLLRMFVNIGNEGRQDWLKGELKQLYGNRLDLMPLLKSAEAKGRDYLLLVTDELIPGFLNFNKSPIHIIGLLNKEGKLGTYSHWKPNTDEIMTSAEAGFASEYYDYLKANGHLELDNDTSHKNVEPLTEKLLNDIIPNELRAKLPEGILREAGLEAKQNYLDYLYTVSTYTLRSAMQSSSTDTDSDTANDDDSNNETTFTNHFTKVHAFGRSF